MLQFLHCEFVRTIVDLGLVKVFMSGGQNPSFSNLLMLVKFSWRILTERCLHCVAHRRRTVAALPIHKAAVSSVSTRCATFPLPALPPPSTRP